MKTAAKKLHDAMRDDALEIATVAAKVSGLRGSQVEGLALLFQQFAEKWLNAGRDHFCVRCHHRWTGELVAEYCGDCHRVAQAALTVAPPPQEQS